MGSIRPLTAEDGPRLAEVHLSAFGHFANTEEEVRRAYSPSNLAMLFEHRYRAHATPPLAFEVDGIVVGYVLTMCRPAVFSGKRVWIATTSHLAVDPEFRSSLAAIHLLREVTNGPQDLTYIDRSNSAGRKSEMAAGFEPLPAYSLG